MLCPTDKVARGSTAAQPKAVQRQRNVIWDAVLEYSLGSYGYHDLHVYKPPEQNAESEWEVREHPIPEALTTHQSISQSAQVISVSSLVKGNDSELLVFSYSSVQVSSLSLVL